MHPTELILVLGVSGGVVTSRLVWGAVITVKEHDYLQAATATGSTRMGALVRHVLPNVAAPIIVVFSINIGAVIDALRELLDPRLHGGAVA